MLTASTEDIERIVREVMAQLGAAPQSAPIPAADVASHAAPPAVREGEVCVDDRVVTLGLIAGRLQGAKQLTVPPGALVTPSVCDELRRKGILLVRGSKASAGQKRPRVHLVVGRTRHDPAAAVQTLVKEGFEVQKESSDCMIAATDKLAAAVAAGQSLGVLWTRHTAVALCLANRHTSVRAVLAAGIAATATAVAATGANVLIVDPTAGNDFEKKQVLREFCLGGLRPCPEGLKERLEKRN